LLLLLAAFGLCASFALPPVWGFFAHKRINRLAALTLPPGMMVFYKKHLEYITDHATDADARRYLIAGEGPKHFLDMDHFGTFPFAHVPRRASDAQMLYTHIFGVKGKDTVQIAGYEYITSTKKPNGSIDSLFYKDAFGKFLSVALSTYRTLWYEHLSTTFQEDRYSVPVNSAIRTLLLQLNQKDNWDELLVDPASFGQHGQLPWNLQRQYAKLVDAFKIQDANQILKYSADIGHYVGDAHVPLHTVSNYNGQKTGQDGIHAFWESRLPELFADDEYDYFVGQPSYVANMDSFIWEMVFESHRYADTVLNVEKMLRISFPQREQICADVRSGKQILTQCRNYARAYQTAMDGLVERRMRDAIHNLSSVWYSAWIDAGKPDLSKISDWSPDESEKAAWKELQKAASAGGKMLGRDE
jgi:hypothetical protein